MRGQSLIESIGSTPIVEVGALNKNPNVRIRAKLEGNNPGGSVKDRPARHMILAAEASCELTHDKVILEPTSGNTGIALAMIAAARDTASSTPIRTTYWRTTKPQPLRSGSRPTVNSLTWWSAWEPAARSWGFPGISGK